VIQHANFWRPIATALLVVGVANTGLAQSVSYDFTGSVTGSFGAFSTIADGTEVTGTVTFDYAAAQNLSGTIGTTGGWLTTADSGSYNGTAPSPAFIFSETVQVAGVNYQTGANLNASTYSAQSSVAGSASSATSNNYFLATEATINEQPYNADYSDFFLESHPSDPAPYSSAGLPLFNLANAVAGGYFGIGSNANTVNYNITSLTPVATTSAPEIGAGGAASALTLLLGALAIFRSGHASRHCEFRKSLSNAIATSRRLETR